VADYRNIPDPERVGRRGIFIAEGRRVVRRLLTRSRLATRSVMVTEAALDDVRPALAAHPDVPVYVVPQPVMNEIAGFNIHRGCLALGERPEPRDWRSLARDARRLVILERIGDPDNVGSAFRNSAAFGVDAVLLDPATTDPLYRKAIRTSMGATLVVPFARIGRPGPFGPGDWPRALGELDREGVAVVALTPFSTAPCLRTIAEQVSNRRVALVLGHEGDGLTQGALDACGLRARIPMAPGADSINVAAAAAIAMYEFSGKWKV
jgi:tRNA G18 (ribose-2'-O)-methylase SpoU